MPVSPPSSNADLCLRLLAATVAGGIVGLNRKFHHQAAGTRTLSLVSLGCALPAALAVDMGVEGATFEATNIARAIQGILAGIGFMGAGVIIHRNDAKGVHGLTTAASVWVTAGMGLAFGVGYWSGALITFAILFVVLVYGGPFQSFMHSFDRNGKATPKGHSESND